MDYTSRAMSDECFWEVHFGDRATLIFLGMIVFALIGFWASRHWQDKPGASKTEHRMNTLKFWSFLWLVLMGYFAYEIYNVNVHPEELRYISECRFRSLDYVLNNQFYPGIALFAFLIIPILFEYWSIKSGKKNPSMSNLSGLKVALILIPIASIIFLISYYFYNRIMAY